MSPSDMSSVLRRKLDHGPGAVQKPVALSPQVAAMRAMARAGFIAAGLKVTEQSVAVDDLDGATDLEAYVADVGMIVPCDAPDGARGYLALCAPGVTALVEKTTTGRLAETTPDPRNASSIDRLLCGTFFERFLEAWRDLLDEDDKASWIAGYALSDAMLNPDAMAVSAQDIGYRAIAVQARFDGVRDVTFRAVLPRARPQPETTDAPGAEGLSVAEWAKEWRAAVLESPTDLDAVLCRLDMSIDDVRRWSPGDQISLPLDTLASVSLGRRNGPCVATARLGQARGVRALRLNEITTARQTTMSPEQTAPVTPALQPAGHSFQETASSSLPNHPNG